MTITSETVRKAAKAAKAYRDQVVAALEVARALGADTSGGGYVADALADGLDRVADAMDGMVPLPVGADKSPLRPEEHVWGEDGREWVVTAIAGDGYGVWIREPRKPEGAAKPARGRWFTHERPDSFERVIRDAIDAGEVTRAAELPTPEDRVRALVARCERLAGELR